MLEALQSTLSNVTASCKKVGIGRTTYYDWLQSDPAFAHEVEMIKEMRVDYIEAKLMQGIDTGNMTGIIFALKSLKPDVYSERLQVTGKGDLPIKVEVDIVKRNE